MTDAEYKTRSRELALELFENFYRDYDNLIEQELRAAVACERLAWIKEVKLWREVWERDAVRDFWLAQERMRRPVWRKAYEGIADWWGMVVDSCLSVLPSWRITVVRVERPERQRALRGDDD